MNCLTIIWLIDIGSEIDLVTNRYSASVWSDMWTLYSHRVWRCNASGLKSIWQFSSGLLSSANVINPSDTTCFALNLPRSVECRNCSHCLVCELAHPSYLHHSIKFASHIILRNRNLTMCCPARQCLIGVANNYVHRLRFFTSQLRQHNCIITVESASATVVFTNWLPRCSSVIPLRTTWLTIMFTSFASRCLAYKHRKDMSHVPAAFKHASLPQLQGNPCWNCWIMNWKWLEQDVIGVIIYY